MNVILLKDIDNLGYKHDVVTVKPGYGRNYLIPQGVAVVANAANQEKLDKILAEQDAKEAAKVDDYKALAEKLSGETLKIGVKSGTSGKIFGSVTNIQVANALKEQMELDIERKKIIMPNDIKELGTYEATIKFYKEIETVVNLELIKE
jgi:large subunit ribosomal protein L9